MSPFHPSGAQKTDPARPSLARQITRRTTDLLAIGLVLAAGLSFGRQVIEWWHTGSENPASTADISLPAVPSGDRGAPIALEFGDTPMILTRQELAGDRNQAIRQLAATCRVMTQSASDDAQHADEKLDSADAPLLSTLAGQRPFEEVRGKWRLYQIESPLLLIIGVRDLPNHSKPAEKMSDETRSPAATSRVTCWGTVLQRSEQAWTLYTFQTAPRSPLPRTAVSTGLPQIPFPPGARRLLALRDQSGGALVGFAGSGPPAVWMRHYDDWFQSHGWRSPAGWQNSGSNWMAGFHPVPPATERVEIHFSGTEADGLSGLVTIFPAAQEPRP